MAKDTIIVLSGGLDSTTMLYEYRERIALAVSFHYGSKHNDKELAFAKLHCERLGIEHIVISLGFIRDWFHSSLLQGGEAVPEGNYDETWSCYKGGDKPCGVCGTCREREQALKEALCTI